MRLRLAREADACACYSSPLARALQTAVATPPTLTPVPLDSLREIQVGPLEGVMLEEVQAQHPDHWERHLAHMDDEFAWPGGETYRGFRERALKALAELAERHAAGRILVFTHAGFISQVVGAIAGTPAGRWDLHRPGNASITEVSWNGNTGAVISFDDQRHLIGLA